MKVKIEPRSRWKGARKFSGRSMRLLKDTAVALASVGLDGLLVVRLAEHPLAILAGRSATGDRWLMLAPYFDRLLHEIVDICERPGLSHEDRQRLIDKAVEQTLGRPVGIDGTSRTADAAAGRPAGSLLIH